MRLLRAPTAVNRSPQKALAAAAAAAPTRSFVIPTTTVAAAAAHARVTSRQFGDHENYQQRDSPHWLLLRVRARICERFRSLHIESQAEERSSRGRATNSAPSLQAA